MRSLYRADIIGQDGTIIGHVAIGGDDDASATARVEKLVNLHRLDLRCGDRKIASFAPRVKQPFRVAPTTKVRS